MTDPSVVVRPWGEHPGDASALAAAWADPDVARFTAVPVDRSPATARRWVTGAGRTAPDGPALDLVIADRADPTVVHGEVGAVVVDRTRGLIEIGYWVAPASRGAGRAAVAVDLVVSWLLHPSVGWSTAIARVDPANPASAAVVRRAGFGPAAGRLADGRDLWRRDAATVGG